VAHRLHLVASTRQIRAKHKELSMRSFANACVVLAVAGVVLVPAPVRADGYVNPWIGVTGLSSSDTGQSAIGVTTGYMGGGVFGFEADFGYSPDFFGVSDNIGKTSAITFTGDAILGIPIGGTHGAGVRPFVSGGFGLMRTARQTVLDVSESNNELCYDFGVGMMGFFAQHIGLRGDLRYFRTLEDMNRFSGFDFSPGRLRFWRVSGGLTFR
jgi:outer membrane protein with beta-barrel domain